MRTVFFTLRVTGTGFRSFWSLILKTNTNTVQSVTVTENHLQKQLAESNVFYAQFVEGN